MTIVDGVGDGWRRWPGWCVFVCLCVRGFGSSGSFCLARYRASLAVSLLSPGAPFWGCSGFRKHQVKKALAALGAVVCARSGFLGGGSVLPLWAFACVCVPPVWSAPVSNLLGGLQVCSVASPLSSPSSLLTLSILNHNKKKDYNI